MCDRLVQDYYHISSTPVCVANMTSGKSESAAAPPPTIPNSIKFLFGGLSGYVQFYDATLEQ